MPDTPAQKHKQSIFMTKNSRACVFTCCQAVVCAFCSLVAATPSGPDWPRHASPSTDRRSLPLSTALRMGRHMDVSRLVGAPIAAVLGSFRQAHSVPLPLDPQNRGGLVRTQLESTMQQLPQ